MIESWATSLVSGAEWKAIEEFSATITALSTWKSVEAWSGVLYTRVEWQLVETWNTTIFSSPATWELAESWTTTINVLKAWNVVERWEGSIRSAVPWHGIESWSVKITTPPIPDFTVSIAPSSATVQQGASGTATVTIGKIGDYSNSVNLSVSGLPSGCTASFSPSSGTPPFTSTMTISVGRTVPPGTYPITISGRDGEGKVRTAIFTLTVAGLPVSVPTSSINPITPYWQTSLPITITATATDIDGRVVSVALYYRHSSDNFTWAPWTLFGIDNSAPWSWSFTAPEGEGYYEFYSLATDDEGNSEPAPLVASASCGVDLSPPPTPAPISPLDEQLLSTTIPQFIWTEENDLSGITYELAVDDNPDFSSPLLKTGLKTPAYILSENERLAEDVYFWKVRAIDGAGLASEWSDPKRFFVIDLAPTATISIGYVPAGGIIDLDLTPYLVFITKAQITVNFNLSDVTANIREYTAEEFGQKFEWLSPVPGVPYAYYSMVSPQIDKSKVNFTRVEFKISKAWITTNEIDENTIRLMRLVGGRWENVAPTKIG
ncbi:MAG: PGF-pre-PGF domain-containing protein, partial [Candidatus Hadarchaeales archaeon]